MQDTMGRYARGAIAGTPYHILNRGNNRQAIFFNEEDYAFFLDVMFQAKEKYSCRIYSYVLMTNHFHLIAETDAGGGDLATFMKQVTQRHGQYINRFQKRSGTLWEGRFKSSAVSSDQYMLACSRYIEMNPVRAGIVEKPEEYSYSSYRFKIGMDEGAGSILDTDPCYQGLGDTDKQRQENYRRFVQKRVYDSEWRSIRESIQRNWAYGNSGFLVEMTRMLGRTYELKKVGRKPKRDNANGM
jgi:putative transposase